MKRHNFAGQRASHGAHRVHRAPGSIGQCATPARVFKGTRMAGRMGGEQGHHPEPRGGAGRRRAQPAAGQGSVPGPKGGLVIIRNAVKGGK
jgi:large subunit ribosomal protein L3